MIQPASEKNPHLKTDIIIFLQLSHPKVLFSVVKYRLNKHIAYASCVLKDKCSAAVDLMFF